MWDSDLEIAKQYIKQGRYDKAREILLMMPDNYVAQDWLRKLNQREFGQSQRFNHSPNPVVINQTIQQVNNSKSSGCFGDIPGLALAIIFLNMLLWGGLTVMTAFATSPDAGVMALFGVIIFFGISFLLSYLYWKFYWWMLAISWTLLTMFALCAAVNGIQGIAM